MSRRARLAVSLAVVVALTVPAVAAASVAPPSDEADRASFDTPKPTPRPRDNGGSTTTQGAERTPRPGPTEPPVVELVALPPDMPPARDILTVAYRGSGLVGQAPLLLAQARGYFAEAGLSEVVLARSNDPIADIATGETDIGVMRYRDASAAMEQGPGIRAIAGYGNYDVKNDRFGGDALFARPGLVEGEPSTVRAFLEAYLRALRELSSPDSADLALQDLIEFTDVAVNRNLSRRWNDELARYAPFDGGFGARGSSGGLQELEKLLAKGRGSDVDPEEFLSPVTLNLAQVGLGLPMNPLSDVIGPPSVTRITVGLPPDTAATSPIIVAEAAGYFEDVGFDDVDIVEVERALPGVTVGQLHFAVVGLQDAGDGIVQGLPLGAVAGHQNYADGAHGGDFVVAAPALLDGDGPTITAFLVAYVRALDDLRDRTGTDELAPYDGGFGERTRGGGLEELAASLEERFGDDVAVSDVVAADPLAAAQAWWGLPSNPTTAPPLADSVPIADVATDAEESA